MLREVAQSGVFVSTHPDIIMKLGTKEVLYQTQHVGWGCDTHRYQSLEQMQHELPLRLADGKVRVLKQNRGQNGIGVWRVALAQPVPTDKITPATLLRVRHAMRGCNEEHITLEQWFARCAAYFANGAVMIDQA